jgi:hypothetical protein
MHQAVDKIVRMSTCYVAGFVSLSTSGLSPSLGPLGLILRGTFYKFVISAA